MRQTAVLFDRWGPYHAARLAAAGNRMPILGVEFAEETTEYAWDRVEAPGNFERVTLLPDRESQTAPGRDLVRELHRFLDRSRPAVVAVPGWSHKGAIAALQWCIRSGTPAVVMSESQAIDKPRRRWDEGIKRRLIRLFSAGLVGGTPHARYLVSLGMPRGSVFTGYDAIDNAFFTRGAEAARQNDAAICVRLGMPERYFLASSRFLGQKNLLGLLQGYAAYRNASGPDLWKLVLLGDGPLRTDVLRWREELELTEDVLLPGFQQYDVLPAYYALAEAFVHASTLEPWGLVINEAMASGLPVIVSERCGCAPDLVRNGVNGFVFDPYQPEILGRYLTQFAAGEHDLAAMGRAGSDHIRTWGVDAFADGLEQAVEAALQAPKRQARGVDRVLLNALLYR